MPTIPSGSVEVRRRSSAAAPASVAGTPCAPSRTTRTTSAAPRPNGSALMTPATIDESERRPARRAEAWAAERREDEPELGGEEGEDSDAVEAMNATARRGAVRIVVSRSSTAARRAATDFAAGPDPPGRRADPLRKAPGSNPALYAQAGRTISDDRDHPCGDDEEGAGRDDGTDARRERRRQHDEDRPEPLGEDHRRRALIRDPVAALQDDGPEDLAGAGRREVVDRVGERDDRDEPAERERIADGPHQPRRSDGPDTTIGTLSATAPARVSEIETPGKGRRLPRPRPPDQQREQSDGHRNPDQPSAHGGQYASRAEAACYPLAVSGVLMTW